MASPNHTRPTGFSAEPPPGPAIAGDRQRDARRATGRARRPPSPARSSRETAPCVSSVAPAHAEHLHLGVVGIGDEAAVDDIATSRRCRSAPRRSCRRCRIRPWRASMPLRLAGARARRGEPRGPFGRRAHSGTLAGKDDARRGDRGDAFLAADEAQPLVGRRLDRDAVRRRSPSISASAATMAARCGPTFGASADQRHVGIGDPAAARAHQRRRMLDEDARGRALPLRIGGRKMRADVAGAAGGEQRVGQGMQRRHRRRNGRTSFLVMRDRQRRTASRDRRGSKACTS